MSLHSKRRGREAEPDLIDQSLEAIASVPGIGTVRRTLLHTETSALDAIFEMSAQDSAHRIGVIARDLVHPRDAREAVQALHDALRREGHAPSACMLVAQAIATTARPLLAEQGIGYFDASGSLYLSLPGMLVMIDRPPRKRQDRMVAGIFEGRTARILHTAFDLRDRWLAVRDFAQPAEVAASTASDTLSEMQRREWMSAQGRGPAKLRRLSAPGDMVDAWAAFAQGRKAPGIRRYRTATADPADLSRQIDAACTQAQFPYALTGERAAQLYLGSNPNEHRLRCRVMEEHADQLIALLDAQPARGDWNLELVSVDAAVDLHASTSIAGLQLASPLQTYLDLARAAGPADPLAAQFREALFDL